MSARSAGWPRPAPSTSTGRCASRSTTLLIVGNLKTAVQHCVDGTSHVAAFLDVRTALSLAEIDEDDARRQAMVEQGRIAFDVVRDWFARPAGNDRGMADRIPFLPCDREDYTAASSHETYPRKQLENWTSDDASERTALLRPDRPADVAAVSPARYRKRSPPPSTIRSTPCGAICTTPSNPCSQSSIGQLRDNPDIDGPPPCARILLFWIVVYERAPDLGADDPRLADWNAVRAAIGALLDRYDARERGGKVSILQREERFTVLHEWPDRGWDYEGGYEFDTTYSIRITAATPR